jgi:hypothetical protein
MDYSINDVVCLMRCDNVMNYINDQILTQMEFGNTGLMSNFIMTQAQMNVIFIGRLFQENEMNYLL